MLADHQTMSYWDHITGECVHSERKGLRLPVANLHQTTAAALDTWPDARIAISGHPFNPNAGPSQLRSEGRFQLGGFFEGTMGADDTRRDRTDLGLGLWADNVTRYYPLSALRDVDGFILDALDSRPVLIVLDRSTGVPAAYFVEASSAHSHADHLHLDNGLTFADGIFHYASGDPVIPDRPMQLFSRWYGCSFTFPDCEIYEPKKAPAV